MTKTKRLVLLVGALVVALAAALAVAYYVRHDRMPKQIRVVGKTFGPGDRPLADVRVVLEVHPGDSEEEAAIERVETLSDARGDFSIDFVGHWPHATYRLEARKPGFQNLSIEDASALPAPVILRFATAPS